jgi:hypothetical protein
MPTLRVGLFPSVFDESKLRLARDTRITAAWRRTLEHAGHARSRARNEDNIQLCQPTMPESRVRGVVGVRVLLSHAHQSETRHHELQQQTFKVLQNSEGLPISSRHQLECQKIPHVCLRDAGLDAAQRKSADRIARKISNLNGLSIGKVK